MYLDCFQPENQTPERALSEAKDAILAVHKAFGAPGDYGYGMPQGEALRWLYETLRLIGPALKQLKESSNDPAS